MILVHHLCDSCEYKQSLHLSLSLVHFLGPFSSLCFILFQGVSLGFILTYFILPLKGRKGTKERRWSLTAAPPVSSS